jgi:hypothetical protein
MKSVIVLTCAAVLMGSVACERNSRDRPASTVTYSARAPRPDTTAASARTLDSTGFVDNAGRTSEQLARTEASGMRATETGSERPTGTPGSGTPLPIEAKGQQPQAGEGAGALGGDDTSASGAPGDGVVARIARARCDRETACDRIGPDKPLRTGEQCMSTVRGRARADVVDADCERGFDSTQVALCLTTIRQVPCETALDAIASLSQCQASALCSL